ncbi:peptide/nickel transport system ATP-binding protein [Bradyrhizobium sp. GM7.3]
MAPVDPALKVSNLNVSFRVNGRWCDAVKNFSLDVGFRETVAIVRESGSGKSVTALSALGVLPPNSRVSGSIRLRGRELLGLTEEELRTMRGNTMAMIFQEPMTSLNPVLKVGLQVAEALRYHRGLAWGAAKDAAIKLLEQVRIPNARQRAEDYPHKLSGGMRQRIMIAMALACRPSLLIADEPTTALDVTVQAQILGLMRQLQAEVGMGLLFITHDMGVVAEIADRVVVMWRGEKVEEGPVAEIFRAPKHPYTRSLLAAVPCLGDMKNGEGPRLFARPSTETAASSSMAASQPVLQVNGLTTRFDQRRGLLNRVVGRVHAVEGVSFDLASSETLALVGESGCGKSTTGRSILRLVEPIAGSVKFDGEDVLQLDAANLRRVRQKIQMVFQDPFSSLDPRQMVGDAIAEPLRVHGIARGSEADDRVVALLRRVGLSPEARLRYPHEFSGGQRQRLCIARALALEPRVIIADEAVSALDVMIKAQVIDLMLELQGELGLSYLFISHDMAIVERVSHRVAVMYLGEIVEIGPRSAVFGDPSHPYTRKLLSAVPAPDPARRSMRFALDYEEIPSVFRGADYRPPQRHYTAVGPDHFVQAKI